MKSDLAERATRWMVLTMDAAPALEEISQSACGTVRGLQGLPPKDLQDSKTHCNGHTKLFLLLHLQIPHNRPW